jgi:hypothetical protein
MKPKSEILTTLRQHMNWPGARLLFLTANMILCLLSTVACDPAKAATFLANTVSLMLTQKSLVEEYVRDVKKAFKPTDPEYKKAEADYNAAQTLHEGYLGAITMAVAIDQPNVNIEKPAADAQTAAATFIGNTTRSLLPNEDLRGLQIDRAIVLPDKLPKAILSIPVKDRKGAVANIQSQVRWRSWEEI